jgi:2-haloalkanoic acid dehalogenase type II
VIRCIAFDCFGTVFDMSSVPREEIAAYVNHVKREDFSPFQFPKSWYELKAHPDSVEGVKQLQAAGYFCVTLSNGPVGMTRYISKAAGIEWNHLIDLVMHKAYKPKNLKAYLSINRELGFDPHETLMVTANPTFGDIEGAKAVGMPSQVIRHGHPNTIIELAEMLSK